MHDDKRPQAGDLVPDGSTIVWEDTPERLVLLVRDGPHIRIVIQPRTLQALFDQNAAEAAEYNRTGSTDSMTKVASIPSDLYWMWQAEGRTDDPRDLARILNDGDHAKLRTTGHRL